MTSVRECYNLTKELQQVLQTVTTENRDEVIEKIEVLLGKRDSILDQLKPPFTDEEKKLGKEMINMNVEINTKLNVLKSTIQRDINGLSKKKSSVKKYTNPYESVNFDGMFYDKRN